MPTKKFPFANSEVDFFGLFNIEDTERNLEKHYGLIFLYLPGHRAVYLESCPNLNTDFFLKAFRRFTSRRGQAVMLYSDKGKFFIGALEELKKSVKNLNFDKIFKSLRLLTRRENSTSLWRQFWWCLRALDTDSEKSAADHSRLKMPFSRLIILNNTGGNWIRFESTSTHNRRRPSRQRDTSHTHNHFLISRPFSSLPPGEIDNSSPASFKTWRKLQQLMNNFRKRLAKEYLQSPHKRSKLSESNQLPLTVNDVVWALKDMTPRGIWSLGRVLEVYPGRRDGQHRVVKVKTAYGTFVRPVSALTRVLAD